MIAVHPVRFSDLLFDWIIEAAYFHVCYLFWSVLQFRHIFPVLFRLETAENIQFTLMFELLLACIKVRGDCMFDLDFLVIHLLCLCCYMDIPVCLYSVEGLNVWSIVLYIAWKWSCPLRLVMNWTLLIRKRESDDMTHNLYACSHTSTCVLYI